ncbi:helix-turn-helix domain-containing protein [Enterocloster bolteae]|uniref:helix-turn-helix domain-containing protein n=1 Tax=Enterocloster bolteae TaxID=208479 RepID=UPI002A7EF38F|nr:helix-turn-helix domain-containing protein [Enterocloster bolteae]
MMTKQAELKKQAYESVLKSRALSVLIYLIDRSNKDLTCFPAIPTMAEQLHISVSTVKRALHELVQAGFIKKDSRFRDKNRGQTSNLYTLVLRENTPEPLESKVSDVEPKQEDKTVCTVEHLTFENLKARRQPETEMVVSPVCKMADTPMGQKEPQTKPEIVEKISDIVQSPVWIQKGAYSLCPAYRSKARKLVHLSFQQRALPVLFQWTGVGFNLQPP